MNPPVPKLPPFAWNETFVEDGVEYPAFGWPSPTPEYKRILVVKGLPDRYRDQLLVAAQGSPTPHAWRVDQQLEPAQVSEDVLAQARVLVARDVGEYANTIIFGLAEAEDGRRDLFGVAAARKRINPGYDSSSWVVIGRLMIVPEFRGKGIARQITLLFFGTTQHLCGTPAIGCLMPTETEQTRRLCRRAVEQGFLEMIPTGRKQWRLIDAVLDVEVYAAFYPGMRKWVLDRAVPAREGVAMSSELGALLDRTEEVWRTGYGPAEGNALGRQLEAVEPELVRVAEETPALGLYHDFLASQRAMGTFE